MKDKFTDEVRAPWYILSFDAILVEVERGMNEEERQRQMDFILEHQAQFAVDIQQLREAQSQFAVDIQQLREAQAQVTVDIQQLREAQSQTDRQLADYAQTQTEFIQIVTRHIEAQGEINISLRTMIRGLNTAQARADERQSRTDERLSSLAATVERYINEARNGKS